MALTYLTQIGSGKAAAVQLKIGYKVLVAPAKNGIGGFQTSRTSLLPQRRSMRAFALSDQVWLTDAM